MLWPVFAEDVFSNNLYLGSGIFIYKCIHFFSWYNKCSNQIVWAIWEFTVDQTPQCHLREKILLDTRESNSRSPPTQYIHVRPHCDLSNFNISIKIKNYRNYHVKKSTCWREKKYFYIIFRHIIFTIPMYIFLNIYFIFNTYELFPKLQYIDVKIFIYIQVIPVNCSFAT